LVVDNEIFVEDGKIDLSEVSEVWLFLIGQLIEGNEVFPESEPFIGHQIEKFSLCLQEFLVEFLEKVAHVNCFFSIAMYISGRNGTTRVQKVFIWIYNLMSAFTARLLIL
jgi:hypothetical protein